MCIFRHQNLMILSVFEKVGQNAEESKTLEKC